MNLRILLTSVPLSVLMLLILSAQSFAQNETPKSNTAALFAPCAFDVGSDAGPLEDTASKQGYTYSAFINEQATLPQFVSLIQNAGILQIATHGNAFLLVVECYPGTGTGRRARNAAFADYVNGTNVTGKNPNGLTFAPGACIQKTKGARKTSRRYWLVGPIDRTYHGIILSDTCIQQLTAGATNAPIIFSGSCNSWGLHIDYLNEREYFGYAGTCRGSQTIRDSRLLFQRMDGRIRTGLARPVHGSNALRPDGSRTAFGIGGFTPTLQNTGAGNTTLAPIVHPNLDGSFAPQDEVTTNITVPGHVFFDTTMSTAGDAANVVSVTGDTCTATLQNVRWKNNTELEFDVVVGSAEGTLTFTVNANSALSANNAVELDGNQDPKGRNGVAPSKDNFQWTVECKNPAQVKLRRHQDGAQAGVVVPSGELIPIISPPGFELTPIAPQQPPTETISFVEPNLLLVTDPDAAANGIFQVESGNTQQGFVLYEVSDLVADNVQVGTTTLPSSTIPSAAITLDPLFSILDPGAREAVVMSVDIPAAQPSGTYSGTIGVTINGADAQQLPIQLVVNQTPVLTVPVSQTVSAGQTLTVTVRATDAEGETVLLYAETLPDGESETVSSFVDNGDGTATFSFTPEADMIGSAFRVPIIASNAYSYDPDVLDSFDFPPSVPHAVRELEIRVGNLLYLPLIEANRR